MPTSILIELNNNSHLYFECRLQILQILSRLQSSGLAEEKPLTFIYYIYGKMC